MKSLLTGMIAATAILTSSFITPADAQSKDDYPSKPVTIVIGFGPGSGTDIIARFLAQELGKSLGQPFIVENRPGAAAQIAAATVARAKPDGYTLLLTSNSSHSVNPHLVKNLPYDPITDFTPVGGVAYFPFLLAVNPSLPIKTPQELVSWAKSNMGKVNYAYGTNAVQIPSAAINNLMGLGAIGVGYKSSPEAMTDVINGQANFLVVDFASSKGHVAEGKLRPIAVTTAKRSALAPELPTIEESLGLKDFDLAAWTGVFGPAGLPKEIVERLNKAMQETLNRSEIKERVLTMGAEPTPSDPATFAELVKRQLAVWGQKIKDAEIKAQ